MPTARLKYEHPSISLSNNNTLTQIPGLPKTLTTPFGLALVEIQGSIQVGDSPLVASNLTLDQANLDLGHCTLGDIEFSGSSGEATLLVGKHQLLRGKIVKLPSPLAVLKIEPSQSTEIPVLGVVYYKLLFNNRPEPVI